MLDHPAVLAAAARIREQDHPVLPVMLARVTAYNALEAGMPWLRVEFLCDLADELADTVPAVARILDELANSYYQELSRG